MKWLGGLGWECSGTQPSCELGTKTRNLDSGQFHTGLIIKGVNLSGLLAWVPTYPTRACETECSQVWTESPLPTVLLQHTLDLLSLFDLDRCLWYRVFPAQLET